ncbi:MAG TPA: hypothetical protein VKU37_07935 [Verrucomicrobiae bacterium]|nr:hypothetical protein [Verrucomicrobiae bacterium]
MKIWCIIIFTLLLVDCANAQPGGSLTTTQASTIALQLANDKASSIYKCQPFRDGRPACFVDGHWVWMNQRGYGHGDFQVTVELADDGSTNSVDLKLLDSQNELPFP